MNADRKIVDNPEVVLATRTLKEILIDKIGNDLKIPDYQRIYCWEEKQVLRLLNDVYQYAHKPYHMGTIILHKRDNGYDIVDGQQRLVTLTLLIREINPNQHIPLAEQNFYSEEAVKYVAYNRWLIQSFAKTIDADLVLDNLRFSVLILSSQNLDLAYTFFTSNSSRGKALSDYDLLKSHHLRFIHIPEQAEHVAGRWDDLIRQSDNEDQNRSLARTFEIYLFRLRNWMRKRTWNEYEQRKIKNHFEAALIIPEISPFGEQLNYYESIQGGSHFFAYAEHFINRYKEFEQTEPYVQLHKHLNWEKHWWYRDVIEALVFAYFLKFGNQYLCDAFLLISKKIAQHRYNNSRAYLRSIFDHVSNSEIVMMLDQATSPTFFLAELKQETDPFPAPESLDGTRLRFNQNLNNIYQNLQAQLSINLGSNGNK